MNLGAGQIYPGPAGASIPVNFRIPWDAKSTDSSNARNTVIWQLEASADVPGVDYHDVFEVPVFRTAQTPAHEDPENSVQAAPYATRPNALTVVVTESASGVEFYFPAARNKGFAGGTTIFLAIFGAVTFFLVEAHSPIIFPLAFGFFVLILFYVSVQMWLGTTRVGIGGGELLVQDGFLGGGKIRRFAFGEIASVSSAIKSQQGGGTGTPYYDIELSLRNGRKVTLGRTLPNKREVDWLVAEFRRLSGPQHRAAATGA
jgi:hypothetical protein